MSSTRPQIVVACPFSYSMFCRYFAYLYFLHDIFLALWLATTSLELATQ